MVIKIEKSDLQNALNIVSKAVSSSDTIPVLKCVLLNAADNSLRLTGNNLELGIQTSDINADIKIPGSVALDAKLFSEIVRKLPDDYIQISVDTVYVTTIKSGKSEFKIIGNNPIDFPVIPQIEKKNRFSIKWNVFKDMLRQTLFAVSEADSKPVFTGELIDVNVGRVNIVAVDGFRIAYRYYETDASEQTFKVIIPGKSMNEIVKLLSGADDSEINIYFTDTHILFELDTCTIISRLIRGEFIDYIKPLDADFTTIVRVNRNELILSLDRASLVALESGKKTPVKLDIKNEAIEIASNTERGTVHEELSANIEGKNLTITFNPRYLIDALKAIDDSEVIIQFNGVYSPSIIRPVEEGNYKYLILPLRLS